ncbi:hypothetical protein ACTXT7_003402 [Hymenolepis weldensis]
MLAQDATIRSLSSNQTNNLDANRFHLLNLENPIYLYLKEEKEKAPRIKFFMRYASCLFGFYQDIKY